MSGFEGQKLAAPQAFMSIKTQFDNLGDALINRELAKLVSDRAVTTIDFSRCPPSFQATMDVEGRPNVRALRWAGYLRMLVEMVAARLVGRKCFFFLNPGGMGRRPLTRKQRLSGKANNVLLRLLRQIGVNICLVGVSYDELDAATRALTIERLSLLRSLAVRDRVSASYLGSAGVTSAGEVVPDLSFNLYDTEPPAGAGTKRSIIAFSFRFDGVSRESIEDAVIAVIKHHGDGFRYACVAQVGRDVLPMQELAFVCAARTGLPVEFKVFVDRIDEIILYYTNCRTIYSNRLHALLLAAYAGASPLAVVDPGRDGKITGLFADLGVSDRVIPLASFSSPASHPTQPLALIDMQYEYGKLVSYFDRLIR